MGWTLVSINSNGSVLDTTTLDGLAVTNLLGARAEVERKLQFQKTEIKVSAPVAPPEGQVVAIQPTVGEVVAVQPQWQPPPFVRTPEAAQIVAWQHPEAAALEALRSFFTKLASLAVWKSTSASGARQFFTKKFLGDDAAVLARSSGEKPAPPRHRAGVTSRAWRTTR